MPLVIDGVGRTHSFSKIRFKFDEELLHQASLDIVDEENRPQMVFNRYNNLHLLKYGRNFEPAHFSNGKLRNQYKSIYRNKPEKLRLILEVSSPELIQKYIGYPPSEIEAAFQRSPAEWVAGAAVIALEGPLPKQFGSTH